MNRQDLQKLSRIRLKEAAALLQLGHFDGAFYLAGYSVECALKACIARATQRHEFPDKKKVEASYSHNLRELVKVAGLEAALALRANADSTFKDHWDVVLSWSERSRYERIEGRDAQKLVTAISESKHGVVAWIRLHW